MAHSSSSSWFLFDACLAVSTCLVQQTKRTRVVGDINRNHNGEVYPWVKLCSKWLGTLIEEGDSASLKMIEGFIIVKLLMKIKNGRYELDKIKEA